MKPEIIKLATPKIGGKCWLLEKPGIFILEQGEGVLRTIACTHAGGGSILAYDGIPDENGFLPPIAPDDPEYHLRHGRPLYQAHPAVMGSWMLDAGFINGFTLIASGAHEGICPIASVVWMPRGQSR